MEGLTKIMGVVGFDEVLYTQRRKRRKNKMKNNTRKFILKLSKQDTIQVKVK